MLGGLSAWWPGSRHWQRRDVSKAYARPDHSTLWTEVGLAERGSAAPGRCRRCSARPPRGGGVGGRVGAPPVYTRLKLRQMLGFAARKSVSRRTTRAHASRRATCEFAMLGTLLSAVDLYLVLALPLLAASSSPSPPLPPAAPSATATPPAAASSTPASPPASTLAGVCTLREACRHWEARVHHDRVPESREECVPKERRVAQVGAVAASPHFDLIRVGAKVAAMHIKARRGEVVEGDKSNVKRLRARACELVELDVLVGQRTLVHVCCFASGQRLALASRAWGRLVRVWFP